MINLFIFNKATGINILGWIGLCSGLTGIFISSLVAWFNTLRNAKIIGVFSELKFERYGGMYKPMELNGVVKPFFILKNIGARPAVIEGVRLRFIFDRKPFFAHSYLVSTDKKIDEEFIGYVLPFNEILKNELTFKTDKKNFLRIENLAGNVSIELKLINKNNWVSIKTNSTNFSFTREEVRVDESKKSSSDFYSKPVSKSFKAYTQEKN